MNLKSLDFDRYVKTKYGNQAKVVTLNDHLHSWRIEISGKQYHLDVNAVAKWQHGMNYVAVSTGVHKYDWCAINLQDLNFQIIPVIMISKDKWFDIPGVKTACENLLAGLEITSDWYSNQMGGKSFSFLNKVLVFDTAFSSQKWNEFANATNIPDTTIPDPFPGEPNREILEIRLRSRFESVFGRPYNFDGIFCTVPYTGLGTSTSGAGALCRGNYVAQPPSIVEFNPKTTSNQKMKDGVIYAIGHELGHAFGLKHSCEVYPGASDCWDSIMQNPSNNFSKAKLLFDEINILKISPYFN
ncbi:MAG: hypothetical protein CMP76_16850 [Flavobacterium sp.]|uniref:hypothetical protein n=1 Tax=Flavobacterium sp. TaxID=239 RepID=UPI000C677230|nr:hypothetical protein [Flavobacterium sp.]MBF04951.1 hypothetical protein [Flavobacterium sp.]|tara:strand:- start:1097 stop:1993 length:897 start_codon:yes stop_codon:yes gene_type:complete